MPAEYTNFTNIFSKKLAKILPKQTGINKHAIKLENYKQLPYKPIYSLKPVELKILKTYIIINLGNGLIQFSKFLASVLILFVYIPNNSLYLCVDY